MINNHTIAWVRELKRSTAQNFTTINLSYAPMDTTNQNPPSPVSSPLSPSHAFLFTDSPSLQLEDKGAAHRDDVKHLPLWPLEKCSYHKSANAPTSHTFVESDISTPLGPYMRSTCVREWNDLARNAETTCSVPHSPT